jgi:hypothetical protein
MSEPRSSERGESNGGGGSRSVTVREFARNSDKSIGSKRSNRSKAAEQVQTKYSR